MPATLEERQAAFARIDLYPVTDPVLSAGRSHEEILRQSARGGARIIQLRDKFASRRQLFETACRFREVTAAAGMLLIINDYVDIALACQADGVHLGQDDLPLAAARQLAPELLIGISTHSLEQALAAQAGGAGYVNIGPVFPTRTKEKTSPPLGPDTIPVIASRLRIPFTVMGGINHQNMPQVLAAGATRIAVVTAVTLAPDPAEAVARLRRLILAGPSAGAGM